MMETLPPGRAPEPATAGAWLRQARQQRGLHIAALAVMLKVPQAKLEALEADRHDDLPDATFARALATAVCRALKVDAGPVLALLPRTTSGDFDMRPGLNQPFRERAAGGISDGGVGSLLTRPVVWGPALLLVAAAVIYWIPASWLPDREGFAVSPAAPASSTAGEEGAVSAPIAVPVPSPTGVSPAVAPASAPASAVLSVPVAASPAAPIAPVAEPVASAPLQVREVRAPAAAGSASGLRVAATADTWIEVTDARGQITLSRVLRDGERVDVAGLPPLKVRVGNVRGTQIEWRGEAVDLAARANNNVARLELK